MKEYCNCYEIIGNIYRESFQSDLTEVQKQRPFLRCTALMSAEQAAVFILKIKQHFDLPEDMVFSMIASDKFTYNDLCDAISSFIKKGKKTCFSLQH